MKIEILPRLWFAIQELRKHERWTRSQLEASQTEGLRRVREYAYAHSPFYQKFHRGFEDRALNELPVLTKAMLMEHFDELVTDPSIQLDKVRDFASGNADGRLYLNRYWVTATSGSSGHPGFFLFNAQEWATVIASFARGQEWSGARLNLFHRRKMATVASVSAWHMSSQVAVTAKTPFTPSIRIAASSPVENIVKQLNAWQPDLLIAYASMARILAEEQLVGKLHISPDKVFTSSEVLTDQTRRRVKAAWGMSLSINMVRQKLRTSPPNTKNVATCMFLKTLCWLKSWMKNIAQYRAENMEPKYWSPPSLVERSL